MNKHHLVAEGPRAGSSAGSPALDACTVYYDGACPVCRREIAHYRSLPGADAIHWVDAASCDQTALGAGLDRQAAMRRFHVRRVDGELVSGAAAFVEIWRRLPAFAGLARVASRAPVLAVLEGAYSVFLRARRVWRREPPSGVLR